MSKIVCHPACLDLLRSRLESGLCPDAPFIGGLPIVTNTNMPKTRFEWRPPSDPFIEYEESDYEWLRYFGMGGEHDTGEPVFYMLKGFGPC